jgi:hypothetical protein
MTYKMAENPEKWPIKMTKKSRKIIYKLKNELKMYHGMENLLIVLKCIFNLY